MTQDLKVQFQQYRNKYQSCLKRIHETMRKENVYWGRDLGESIQDHRDAQQELNGPIDAVMQ